MCQENSPEVSVFADMTRCREKIAVLYLMGLSNRDIAQKLGGKALDVARNLREVKRQWERAARRQRLVMQGRFVEVYNESMEAWHKSKEGRLRTCEETQNGEVTKVATRREEGPGNIGFLRMAFGSLKVLRQCGQEKADKLKADRMPAAPEELLLEEAVRAVVDSPAEVPQEAASDKVHEGVEKQTASEAQTANAAPMSNRAARRAQRRAALRQPAPIELNTRLHCEPRGSGLLLAGERAGGRSIPEVIASWGWRGEK